MKFNNFEITKREVMFSIIIILVMVIIGLFIGNAIVNKTIEENEVYFSATKINADADQFKYGMQTSIGNALVYGDFKAVGGVAFPELKQKYFAIVKRTERYTMHTRTVTHRSGKTTYTTVEVYYSWDTVNRQYTAVKAFNFLGVQFPISKLDVQNYDDVPLSENTVSEAEKMWIHGSYLYNNGNWFEKVGDLRFKYEAIPLAFKGTVLANLKNNSMFCTENGNGKISVESGLTTQQVIENIENAENTPLIIFWVIWIIIIGVTVFGFCYRSNNWLEG